MTLTTTPTAIWWIRRDLRLHDNPALAAALAAGRRLIPLFIFDPVLLASPNASPRRLAFLRAARDAPNREGRESARIWLNELIWREFYVSVLHHFPLVLRQEFRANLRGIRWDDGEAAFAAWRDGRTGYPIVDAAMRQLAATGWMHNRARMIVASFLVKDLLVDWRRGERHFMQHLLDGDPAANNGGWQWTAGVGTDAAPYFRVFNPVLQGRRADPEGNYVRRWVPELAGVLKKHIHEPWKLPAEARPANYPSPMVDHSRARARALARYRRR